MNYTNEDLIWLAGFIDGEGCVSYIKRHKRNSFRFEIRITNTDLFILMWIYQRFGGYLYQLRGETTGRILGHYSHWKPSYQWYIADKKAKALYDQLKPYLKGK